MFLSGIGTATPSRRYTKTECWQAFVNSACYARLDARARRVLERVLHQDNGNGKFEQGSDQYLLNGQLLANDIDVVGVERSDRESRILETQVEAYLETNFKD